MHGGWSVSVVRREGLVNGERKVVWVWARVLVAPYRRLRGRDIRGSTLAVVPPASDHYREFLVAFAASYSHVDAPSRTRPPHPSLCAPRPRLGYPSLRPFLQRQYLLYAHGKSRLGLDRLAEKHLAGWGMTSTLKEFRLR